MACSWRPELSSRARSSGLTTSIRVHPGRFVDSIACTRRTDATHLSMDAAMEDGFSIIVRGVSPGRDAVSHSQLASLPPGSILHLPYHEAVQHIEHDLLRACTAAEGYDLTEACELPAELVDLCLQVSQPDCRDDTWDAVMYKRISSSWRHRRSET